MKHILLLLLLTGCSTILEGHSQEINIITEPPSAKCNLIRQGSVIGTVNPTPGSVFIEKTKDDISIECTKSGYNKTVYLNHSGADVATFGNIILGGGIGWAVDSATGSDNKYTSPVTIILSPRK